MAARLMRSAGAYTVAWIASIHSRLSVATAKYGTNAILAPPCPRPFAHASHSHPTTVTGATASTTVMLTSMRCQRAGTALSIVDLTPSSVTREAIQPASDAAAPRYISLIAVATVRGACGGTRSRITSAPLMRSAASASPLGVLVAELRAGAHPGDALRAAAGTPAERPPGVPPDVLRALTVAAAAASLGGDVPAVLRSTGAAPLRSWLDRLADAWSLADRYGIPLADLLDAVRSDTTHRVRFATEVQARLAGPRASASVLAGLPLLGLALGQAVGAAPVRVLCQTPVGQVLLVIGTALACVGVQWSARLVAGAVPA
jgi:tight adherence protein B